MATVRSRGTPVIRIKTRKGFSPAKMHADEVWMRLGMAAGGDDLRFVGMLAQHVVGCERCRQRHITGDAPIQYLERRLATSSARDIWRAAIEHERRRS